MRFDAEWPVLKLGDVVDNITVGHVGSMATEYVPRGIPFLRSQNVRPYTLDLNDVAYIGREFHRRLAKSALNAGDVVIVRTGVPGAAAVVPDDLGPANCSDLVIVKPGPRFDSRFLCYAINVLARTHVSAHLVGAVQQHFNVGSARVIQLPVPPLDEQRAIACAIGSLDDKIALNDRMNHSLEAIAATVFRSWFLDFDPVTAKAEGRRAHGVPRDVHGLMPNSLALEESVLRPAGWRAGTVGAEFTVRMGQSPPGSTYNDTGAGVPFFQGCTDFGFRHPARRLFTTAPSRFAEAGDTLVSVRAPVGRINMASEGCCIGRGLAAVRHSSGASSFTYYAMRALDESFAMYEGYGTLFGAISRDGFAKLPIVVPPPAVIAGYERVAAPLDAQISANGRESTKLVELRDSLLPELLAGTIRLGEAERAVAAVV